MLLCIELFFYLNDICCYCSNLFIRLLFQIFFLSLMKNLKILYALLTCSIGQGSYAGGCSKDVDCIKLKCIDHPICDLTKHQCICQAPPASYGRKNIYKSHQN